MKINLVKIILLFVGILCCNTSFASNNPPPPIPPGPPGGPIDGSIVVLALFSVLLAFYKLYKFKKASR